MTVRPGCRKEGIPKKSDKGQKGSDWEVWNRKQTGKERGAEEEETVRKGNTWERDRPPNILEHDRPTPVCGYIRLRD